MRRRAGRDPGRPAGRAPMFIGGTVVGVVTDRFDPVRTVWRYLLFLMPLSGLMGSAITTGSVPIGLSYLFVALVGVGNVIDMTSRRSIAFELAGPGLLTNAAALESVGLHAGTMAGNLIGGALLRTLDSASVYLGLAVVYEAGFGTTQSALTVSLVDESLLGRALGTLSMAIGALPFGMSSLGLLARRTDPRAALNVSVTVGLVLLVGFQLARPHLRRL